MLLEEGIHGCLLPVLFIAAKWKLDEGKFSARTGFRYDAGIPGFFLLKAYQGQWLIKLLVLEPWVHLLGESLLELIYTERT